MVMLHDRLNDSILLVVRELCGIREQIKQHNENNAILCRLAEMEEKIMSAISDFGDLVNTRFDELGTAVEDVAGDVAFLKAEIKKLQDNPGPITPADQAILDGIQARLEGTVAKVKTLADATENPPVIVP